MTLHTPPTALNWNVSINPKTLIETESLLSPLGKLIPQDASERRKWILDLSLKDAHFDVASGI